MGSDRNANYQNGRKPQTYFPKRHKRFNAQFPYEKCLRQLKYQI